MKQNQVTGTLVFKMSMILVTMVDTSAMAPKPESKKKTKDLKTKKNKDSKLMVDIVNSDHDLNFKQCEIF